MQLKKSLVFTLILGCIVTLISLTRPAMAGPASKVYTPIVEYGETELEFRGGYVNDDEDAADGEQEYVFAVARGLMTRWFSEIALEYEKSPGESAELETVEWENVFQLTEQGQYFVDLGLFVEYAYKREDDEADKLEIGPMFQKEFGQWQVNLNTIFEREVGDNSEDETELSYAFQAKWRGNPVFEPGIQAFGELGEWNDWEPSNEQEHKLGPAFFGKVKLGNQGLKYSAGLLFGLTSASPDQTLRFELELEF